MANLCKKWAITGYKERSRPPVIGEMSFTDVMLPPARREEPMPFSHVRNSYQPEQLQKLTEAFDLALYIDDTSR